MPNNPNSGRCIKIVPNLKPSGHLATLLSCLSVLLLLGVRSSVRPTLFRQTSEGERERARREFPPFYLPGVAAERRVGLLLRC